jgi:DNA-binding transcriptional regulator YiaG
MVKLCSAMTEHTKKGVRLDMWTGEEIKALRKSLNLTQPAFSEALGVSETHISYLENGKRKPSKTLCLLLDSLKTKTEKGVKGHGKKR